LFLGEAAALAAIGGVIGLIVARTLADLAVGLTSATVSTLYIADAAAPPRLGWAHIFFAFGVGMPLSIVAALVPAAEAARVPPVAAIGGADRIASPSTVSRGRPWLAFMLLATGGWLATLGPVNGRPLFGYAAALAIVFGAAFLMPGILGFFVSVCKKRLDAVLSVESWLAITNLSAAVLRLSISVAAL